MMSIRSSAGSSASSAELASVPHCLPTLPSTAPSRTDALLSTPAGRSLFASRICEKTRWHRHSCLCAFAKSNKFSFGEATYRCQIAPFWVFSQLLCEGGILRQRPCGGSLGGGSFSSHVTDKNRNRLLRGAGVHLLASDQGRSYGSNYLGQITAQRLDANIGESIFEGFARKSWNGTKP